MTSQTKTHFLANALRRGRAIAVGIDSVLILLVLVLPWFVWQLRMSQPSAKSASETARLHQIARLTREELRLANLSEVNANESQIWLLLSEWLSGHHFRFGYCDFQMHTHSGINLECRAYSTHEGQLHSAQLRDDITIFTTKKEGSETKSAKAKLMENCPIQGVAQAPPEGLYIGARTRKIFDAKQERWLTGNSTR